MAKQYRMSYRRLLYLLMLKYKGYYRTSLSQYIAALDIYDDAHEIWNRSADDTTEHHYTMLAMTIRHILGATNEAGAYRIDDVLAALELERERSKHL